MRRLLLVLLLAASLVPARASELADAPVVSGAFLLQGRAIALPPGEWRLLGREVTLPQGSALGGESLLLVQESGTRLAGMVVARASTRATNALFANWDRRGACARGDETIAVILREASERAQDCARVTQWTNPAQPPPQPAPEFARYFALAGSQQGWAPARFHSVWIAIADASGDMELYYHFSPETRGFHRDERPWPQNGWNPANLQPRQRDYLARLTAWGRGAHAAARRGFAEGTGAALPGF